MFVLSVYLSFTGLSIRLDLTSWRPANLTSTLNLNKCWNNVNYNLSSIFNNPTIVSVLQVLMGCILFIMVFYMLNYGYNYFTSNNSSPLKLPKLPKLSSLSLLPNNKKFS